MQQKKKIAISQSNFIPWKGYFDMVAMVDDFVFLDDVQYTKRDWRNRNLIKTPNGSKWISIPVEVKGKFKQKISETKISDLNWGIKAWKSIELNYKKAKFFDQYKSQFKQTIESQTEYLSVLNIQLIKQICSILKIETNFHNSNQFDLKEDSTEKLLGICKDLKADTYISGPAAKNYMQLDLFEKQNISVEWMDYNNYPEYNQQYGPFTHQVSILDLIFNEGPNSKNFLKSF